MKILDITTYYSTGRGGITTYLERKAELARAHGDVDHVLILAGDRDETRDFFGSTCHWVRSTPVWGHRHYRFLINFNKILNLLRREKPDVIETCDPYWMPLYLLLMRPWLKKPTKLFFFYRVDFPDTYVFPLINRVSPRLARWAQKLSWVYVRAILNRMDGVLVHTDIMRSKLSDHGVCRPIYPVGNLTHLSTFQSAVSRNSANQDLQEQFGPNAGPNLLYCGRFSFEKGVDLLLDAFNRFLHFQPRATLTMIGTGHKLKEVCHHAADRGNRVFVLPTTRDREYLASLFKSSDVVVVPGPHETFSIVTLEAIAAGTPVVAVSGTGAVRALVQKGVGFLAARNHAIDLVAALLKAVQPKESWYSEPVRNKLLEQYRPARVFERLCDVYRSDRAISDKSKVRVGLN